MEYFHASAHNFRAQRIQNYRIGLLESGVSTELKYADILSVLLDACAQRARVGANKYQKR